MRPIISNVLLPISYTSLTGVLRRFYILITMESQHYVVGPDALKRFLIDTDATIVSYINAAVARLKTLGSEISQHPGNEDMQNTAKDTVDSVVRETNRRMRQINREVRQKTKGHREDGEIHTMLELLNEQIRDAQSLMNRTVNDMRRRLR